MASNAHIITVNSGVEAVGIDDGLGGGNGNGDDDSDGVSDGEDDGDGVSDGDATQWQHHR